MKHLTLKRICVERSLNVPLERGCAFLVFSCRSRNDGPLSLSRGCPHAVIAMISLWKKLKLNRELPKLIQ
jgi:hypothetical protein